MSIDFLRRLPLFAGLSEPDLARLYQQARPLRLPAHHLLIEEGTPGDALYVLIDGELEVTKHAGAHDVKLDVRKPGEVIGEMSLLDHAPRSASVRTLTECNLLMVSQETFDLVLRTSPTAALTILHTVTGRLRQNEALLHEKEKLAGLGKIAAGLAHELNNPAAAVRRASDQLGEVLEEWQQAIAALAALKLDEHQAEHVTELRRTLVERAQKPVSLDPLARSDRESEVEQWLDEHGVAEAWELAPTLVALDWQTDDLEHLAEHFDPEQIGVIARSLGIGSSAYSLVFEIREGARRISQIVKDAKSYTFLDRAPVQEVDVHEGLESTIAILRHKHKDKIPFVREYAPDLPRIEANAGELNQVWTNILDNAIDALNGQGEIRLRTARDDRHVVVELSDNGPGIPPEIQSRVFEPFFTTKPPGVGTGLGLNIAFNIIHQHHGDIRLESRPGRTCFTVRLPIRSPRSE